MARVYWVLGLTALLSANVSSLTSGQQLPADDLQQPFSAQPLSYADEAYLDEEAIKDPAAHHHAAPAGAHQGNCCEAADEEIARLFDCCCLDRCGIEIGGWIDQGITWNPDSPANRFNGPVTFNDRSNEYQLNQMWMFVEKAADNGGCGIALGGRIDLMYGTDHRFTMARGLELHQDLSPKWNSEDRRFYGLAMPQMYLDVAVNDWTFRIGHFFTLIGYEVVPATGNFFYSHTYTMQYGEPFTHTGVLAMRELSDRVSISAGIHRGWDNWEDNNDDLGFLGAITLTGGDVDSLTLAMTISEEDDAGESVRIMYSAVYQRQLNRRLAWVLHHDCGWEDDAGPDATDAEWYSLVNYLFYTINDCWKLGFRYGWFRDDDGVRVIDLTAPAGFRTASFNPAGRTGNWNDLTVGLNYTPNANVILRTECRWDWVDPDENLTGGPFDDFSQNSQFLWATDLIVQF